MEAAMRNLVLGYAALLWGGAVTGYGLTRSLDDGSSYYAAGSLAALACGVVLFFAGGWIILRRARS
jgi:hypothetical protein